jgi:hypothetical protein
MNKLKLSANEKADGYRDHLFITTFGYTFIVVVISFFNDAKLLSALSFYWPLLIIAFGLSLLANALPRVAAVFQILVSFIVLVNSLAYLGFPIKNANTFGLVLLITSFNLTLAVSAWYVL